MKFDIANLETTKTFFSSITILRWDPTDVHVGCFDATAQFKNVARKEEQSWDLRPHDEPDGPFAGQYNISLHTSVT